VEPARKAGIEEVFDGMGPLWIVVFLLSVFLCSFMFLTFRTMPSLSMRHQKRALTFVILAGLLCVAALLRYAFVAMMAWGGAVSNTELTALMLGSLLLEAPVVACLLLAGHYMRRSESEEVSSLRRSANMDPLTSLHNQGYFRRAAPRRISQSKDYGIPITLAMLDLDDFKTYNDVFGHEAGNAMLRLVADILKRSFRADDIVARYGGEEFIVLLNTTQENSEAVLERVRAHIEDFTSPESNSRARRRVTVSVGISELTEGMDSLEDLIESADKALYRAKSGGKNRVVTSTEAA
jgi:diguanylate cyclase (GGDEF)-like protein